MFCARAIVLASLVVGASASAQTAVPVADLTPGPIGSSPLNLTPFGNRLLFTAMVPNSASNLWITRGSAADTHRITDFPDGSLNLLINTQRAGRLAFFPARRPEGDFELWRTDGESILFLGDLNPDGSSNPSPRGHLASTLFFSAASPGVGVEMWRSDGTPEGTFALGDLVPGPPGGGPAEGTEFQGRFFFGQIDGLYVSDSTPSGTRRLNPPTPLGLTASAVNIGPRLIFFAFQTPSPLWRSDGTDQGTEPILVPQPIGPLLSASSSKTAVVNGRLIFVGSNAQGLRAWSTDGSDQGTFPIGPIGNYLLAPVTAGRYAYFAVFANNRCELHRTDGSPNGDTVLYSAPTIASLAACGDRLYFVRSSHFPSLWSTRGDLPSTQPVNIEGSTTFSSILNLTAVHGRLYFTAVDDAHGNELWTIPPVCPPDFNLDAALDPDDLADFIACYFSGPDCLETDFDADGVIDPDDLASFVTAYFAGC